MLVVINSSYWWRFSFIQITFKGFFKEHLDKVFLLKPF